MKRQLTRRGFLKGALAAGTTFSIVPRHVLGGSDKPPPSETLGGALIGVGGRGPGTWNDLVKNLEGAGLGVTKLAECDVRWKDRVDNQTRYTDFRRILDRKDIDVVAIATPPHWHALISIAAMEAGKDVLCEKPMTRSIGEGRAVAEAEKRYGRVWQVCTFGRFRSSRDPKNILTRKIMTSGLVKKNEAVHIIRGGFKVKEWSGIVNARSQPVPSNLDWDMYCGPSPLKPYHPHRVGGTHRGYWDYEGGGLSDMGQHYLDPFTWTYGRDHTTPVEVDVHATPAHPEACGMWGWVEMKYADGFTLVLDSGEWGKPYDRKETRSLALEDLPADSREKVRKMPDPEPLLTFGEAVRQRKRAGGNADVSHYSSATLHLANLAIRVGRKIRFDPKTEQVIGDEEANRLIHPPMRGPWHL
jgi:hypothetical protein